MLCYFRVSILIIPFLLIAPTASAHVPLDGEGNYALDAAMTVDDPGKSWVTYSSLEDDHSAAYYELHMEHGTRVKASLFVPVKGHFMPSLILAGPGLSGNATIPGSIELPEDHGDGEEYGYLVFEGSYSEASYEPFTPAVQYVLAEIDMEVPERDHYHLIVFDPGHEGDFGLAIGYREEFTVQEWLRVPYDLKNIYLWQGQSPYMIFLPEIITFLAGIGIVFWHSNRTKVSYKGIQWLGLVGGSLMIGSGASLTYQMIRALAMEPSDPAPALVTVLFIAIAAVLGVWAIRIALRTEKAPSMRDRAFLTFLIPLSLFLWAGFYIAPFLMAAMVVYTSRGMDDGATTSPSKVVEEEE